MKELLELLARGLVRNEDAVSVTETDGDEEIVLELRVDPDDIGRVIGRQGRTARSLRTLLSVAASKRGKSCGLEIIE